MASKLLSTGIVLSLRYQNMMTYLAQVRNLTKLSNISNPRMLTAMQLVSNIEHNSYSTSSVKNTKDKVASDTAAATPGSDGEFETKSSMDSELSDEEELPDLKELMVENTSLMKDLTNMQDKYRRSLAENENIRRRMQQQIDSTKLFAIQGFCKDLLEVSDILARATETVPKASLSKDKELSDLYQGLVMTESQLLKVFKKHGLNKINPDIGEKFDPNIHEALFQQPVEKQEPGTVASVTKIGFTLRERTLRPALVGVAQAPPPTANN